MLTVQKDAPSPAVYALPKYHGMDPRVCATAFGLLRPRMTKRRDAPYPTSPSLRLG